MSESELKINGDAMGAPPPISEANVYEDDNALVFTICADTNPTEVLRFNSNGDAFVRGEKVDNNLAIYDAFREFMIGSHMINPEGKRPLSIDIYDHRNIVIREGSEPLPFVQGIKFEASAITPPTLEVVLPELVRDELTDEQGKKLSSVITSLQSHGARIEFKPLSEITPEVGSESEQAMAEHTLQQLGFVKKAIRESCSKYIFDVDEQAAIDNLIAQIPTMLDVASADEFALMRFSDSPLKFKIKGFCTVDVDEVRAKLSEATKPLVEKEINTIVFHDGESLNFIFEKIPKRPTLIEMFEDQNRPTKVKMLALVKPVADIIRDLADVGMLTPTIMHSDDGREVGLWFKTCKVDSNVIHEALSKELAFDGFDFHVMVDDAGLLIGDERYGTKVTISVSD
jgi:hypothetical protein